MPSTGSSSAGALMPVSLAMSGSTVDMSVPPNVALAELVPAMVKALGPLDSGTATKGFTVRTSDGHALNQSRTLPDQEVRPGAVLTIEPMGSNAQDQRYDDLIEAVGTAVADNSTPWKKTNSVQLSAHASAALVLLAALLLVTGTHEPIVGATVQSDGALSGAATNGDGRCTLRFKQGVGQAKIEVSSVGYKRLVRTVTVRNGQTLTLLLQEDAKMLGEVTVTGIAGKGGMGAASNFSQKQIDNTPTINRNVYDVAKLSPLVNTSKLGGISIAGSNNRYNSFQIDGMVSNDVFGLASSGTNGGQTGTNPIAMDAIEQIQVVASPFDVRQGGFTGGGINAITKSGTNTFHASAYTYYTDENLYSKWSQVLDKEAKLGKQSTNTYGASLSGAFVKDKVFFFTNIELKKNTYPTSIYPILLSLTANI